MDVREPSRRSRVADELTFDKPNHSGGSLPGAPQATAGRVPVITAIAALACGVLAAAALALPSTFWLVLTGGFVFGAFYFLGGRLAEKALATYWLAFCVFSTILTGYVIGGMFNIFYLWLIIAVVVLFSTTGVVIDKVATWILSSLFAVVFASLVGYLGSLGGVALDRLLFIPIAVFSMFIVASGRTPRLMLSVMVVSSLAVAVWVIVTAASAGFAYRGNLELDQNVVSYYIGIGFTLVFGWFVSRKQRGTNFALVVGSLLVLAVLGYGIVLLASRGAMISLSLVMVAALLKSFWADRHRIWRVVLLLLLTSSALLLPGGQGVLKRFSDPSTETGGGRVLIWETVIDSTQGSSMRQLLLGHGMNASEQLIRHEFGYLSSTHNSFLLILYDYGLLGMMLFASLHVLVFMRLVRRRDTLGIQLLLLLVFQVAIGLFITASDSYLYWLALGLMLGATTVNDRESRIVSPTPPTRHLHRSRSG